MNDLSQLKLVLVSDSSTTRAPFRVGYTCMFYLTFACFLPGRYGVDVTLRNNGGKTAEDILEDERPDCYDENLHWYRKFSPGKFSSYRC